MIMCDKLESYSKYLGLCPVKMVSSHLMTHSNVDIETNDIVINLTAYASPPLFIMLYIQNACYLSVQFHVIFLMDLLFPKLILKAQNIDWKYWIRSMCVLCLFAVAHYST